MKVNLSIHGPIAGQVLRLNSSVQLQEQATLAQLLEAARPQIGVDLSALLRDGNGHPVILLCGENLELPAALDHPLKEGDEVAILQGFAGG
jgi:molybdopterin converting factor small subunit